MPQASDSLVMDWSARARAVAWRSHFMIFYRAVSRPAGTSAAAKRMRRPSKNTGMADMYAGAANLKPLALPQPNKRADVSDDQRAARLENPQAIFLPATALRSIIFDKWNREHQ